MICKTCGHEGDSQKFIVDYYWDEKEEDELPVYQCPNCKEDDENKIEDN